MICRSCLRAAARSRIVLPEFASASITRPFSTGALLRNASPTSSAAAPASTSPDTPAATTSSTGAKAPADQKKGSPILMSSVSAGTVLKGINFLKNKTDPVAMEDWEYPSWLWEILKRQEKKAESGKEGDLFSKSKKQRRLAAKRLRKEQAANPDLLMPKVPVYEQTVDLPAGDGSLEGAVKAQMAREELNKAMRVKRRAVIKEANFLKAMG